jgi:FkbM family methyltransferase
MPLLDHLARSVRPLVERNPRLAMAYRHYRDTAHMLREPGETPFGFKFVGHPAMEAGTFEPDEVRIVKRLLQRTDVLINVGANVGYYCCFALQAGRRVVAIEPVPANLQYLYRNLIANDWAEQAEVLPVALGARRGLVDIFGGGTAASLLEGWAGIPSAYRQTVPLTTLDDCLGDRFCTDRCFVLIDVEGAEFDVLRGAAALLQASPRPIWMVEISVDEHFPGGVKINPNLRATFELFEQAGYDAWSVGPSLVAVQYDVVRAIERTGVNTLAGHNFVFAVPGALRDALCDVSARA